MRIIDKNTDFYDYLQNVYRDTTLTFDRTDSFLLTKKEMCDHLNMGIHTNRLHFCLLQVCNTFWLFLIEVTKTVSESNDTVCSEPHCYMQVGCRKCGVFFTTSHFKVVNLPNIPDEDAREVISAWNRRA